MLIEIRSLCTDGSYEACGNDLAMLYCNRGILSCKEQFTCSCNGEDAVQLEEFNGEP